MLSFPGSHGAVFPRYAARVRRSTKGDNIAARYGSRGIEKVGVPSAFGICNLECGDCSPLSFSFLFGGAAEFDRKSRAVAIIKTATAIFVFAYRFSFRKAF
jgi:hypothetical protein